MFKHNCPLDFLNFTDIEIAEWLCNFCGDDFVYNEKSCLCGLRNKTDGTKVTKIAHR